MAGAALCCGLVVAGWIVGVLFTDRYAWSQWLWWLPTPVVIGVAFVGLMTATRRGSRAARVRRVMTWSTFLVIVLIWFLTVEHRFLHAPTASTEGIVIGHWNMSHPLPEEYGDYAAAVAELLHEVDLLVLTSPSVVSARRELLDALDPRYRVHRFGIFSVITALPIISSRPLANHDAIWSYLIEVDASDDLGRGLVIYLIDLPSVDPERPAASHERSRMDVAREARRLLDALEAPAPDLVVGDFNISRGSASLQHLFPGLRHAWDDGGHGYGATFHRRRPYVHIDHILLADDLFAVRYDIVDPGLSRHLAQRARIVSAE